MSTRFDRMYERDRHTHTQAPHDGKGRAAKTVPFFPFTIYIVYRNIFWLNCSLPSAKQRFSVCFWLIVIAARRLIRELTKVQVNAQNIIDVTRHTRLVRNIHCVSKKVHPFAFRSN